MDNVWGAFLLFIAVAFICLETYAVKTKRNTLSRTVWITSKAFPLLPFLVGALVGGLAVHFFWGGPFCFDAR